jgi:TonB-linked outer membrane protein, SusC/RagA family
MLLSSAQAMYASPRESEVTSQQVSQQQGQTVSGVVTDEKGEALIGVNVSVKGTTKGTITDINGKFTLQVPDANASIQFSYIGYIGKVVPVGSNRSFKVKLSQDTKVIDEVVVVGYGTQKKASLTSAISQIKGEEVFKDRGVTNITVALQGEVPGLVVTRSSTRPGSEGASLKIRGDISINGSGYPLVIIDGVPTPLQTGSNPLDELNGMNPNDIESISVLKDASAAIYGARSANGVVLVTTKRGKQGAAKITYNGALSTTINGIQPSVTTNSQFLDMFYEAQYQDAKAKYPTLTTKEDIMKQFDWWIFGSVLAGVDANGTSYTRDVLWNALRNGETLTLTNSGKTYRYDPNRYLMNELYGQATSQKHSVSVSGADDKFSYMASLGYSEAQSQLKVADDSEKKYSGRLNMNYQATRLLKLEAGMAYEKRDLVNPSTDVGAGYYDPWFWPVYTPQGHFYDTFGNRNPVGGLVGGGQIKTGYITSRSNLKATLDLSPITKGLSVSGSGSYRTVEKGIQTLYTKIQYYDWADVATTSRQSPGSLTEDMNKWENKTLGGFVNYDRTFGKEHHVAGMFGVTSEEENFKEVKAARNQGPLFEGSGLVDLNVMTTGTTNVAEGGQSSMGLLSYVSRLNYGYKDKYLFEMLGRRDGSSRLYPTQRWQNFYSVSGGWVITQENFMQNVKGLDFLKVRYNYGKTGSVEGIGNYEPYALMSSSNSYFGSTLAVQTAMALGGMTSSTRTWETILSHDGGIDFRLFRNRLSGTFDYFSRTNDGMFINVEYPAILGASAPSSNNGKLNTNGWEISLNWKDKIGAVNYNIGGSLSDASTELLKLANNQLVPLPGKNTARLIGKPINAIYVYKTDGIIQTQAEADAYYEKYYWKDAAHSGVKSGNIIPAPQTSGTYRLRPGARKLADVDGDGAITQNDLVYAGDAAPHLNFGIKAGLEWKGIDVQAFFQGVGKQAVLRGGSLYAPWVTNYTLQNSTFMGKMWSEENPNATYTVASRDAGFNKWNYENKDVSVQNSKYIRLKSLVVGYTIPSVLTRKLSVNKIRVYFSGDDLWEWTKIKDGYDPEAGEASNNTFPFSRLLTCGLDVTF